MKQAYISGFCNYRFILAFAILLFLFACKPKSNEFFKPNLSSIYDEHSEKNGLISQLYCDIESMGYLLLKDNNTFSINNIESVEFGLGSEKIKINLSHVNFWNDPGDFIKVEILDFESEIIFEALNLSGWVHFNNEYVVPENILTKNLIESDNILITDLGSDQYFLFLFGYAYASDPGLLTIISLKYPPKIVFNKNFKIIDIQDIDNDGQLEIIGTTDYIYRSRVDLFDYKLEETEELFEKKDETPEPYDGIIIDSKTNTSQLINYLKYFPLNSFHVADEVESGFFESLFAGEMEGWKIFEFDSLNESLVLTTFSSTLNFQLYKAAEGGSDIIGLMQYHHPTNHEVTFFEWDSLNKDFSQVEGLYEPAKARYFIDPTVPCECFSPEQDYYSAINYSFESGKMGVSLNVFVMGVYNECPDFDDKHIKYDGLEYIWNGSSFTSPEEFNPEPETN